MNQLRKAGAVVAHAPITCTLIVSLWVVAIVTDSLLHGPSEQLRGKVATGVPALTEGRWWTPVTSVFWTHGLAALLIVTALTAIALPFAERHLGTKRTLLVMVGSQLIGVVVGADIVRTAQGVGGEWGAELARQSMLGPAGMVLGATLAASAAVSALWRRRVRLLILTVLLALLLYVGLLVDVLHLTIGLTGLVLGMVLVHSRRLPHRPSRTEARSLVALLIAVTALGPVAAALAGTPIGPLAVLNDLVFASSPDASVVERLCEIPRRAAECSRYQAELRVSGVGPAALSLVPVLLLLVSALGLRRGRRAAWLMALIVNLGLGALGAVLFAIIVRTPEEKRVFFRNLPDEQSAISLLVPLLVPLLVAAVLVLARGAFPIRGNPKAAKQARTIVAVAFAATAVLFVGGGLFGGFDRPVSFLQLLAELPRRYVPPGYLVELPPEFLPSSGWSTFVFEWSGVLFWLVVAAAAAWYFTATRLEEVDEETRTRALQLLKRDPRTNLAYMNTWPGNRYWFTADGETAVAYRVVGAVAIALCSPFGARGTDHAAVAEFDSFTRAQGWTPCFYTVPEVVREACAALGYSSLQVAEETVLPLPQLAFTGKKWQDVRTALNKAGKEGIAAEWHVYATAPRAITDQVRAISEEWIADKGLPEMGFTLGGMDELMDPNVRMLLAVDADRTVHGVTSWMPVYRDEVVVGWTLDFMRRRDGGFRGVMEFLIASAALLCKAEGAEFLSLSGAPLARVAKDDDEQEDWLSKGMGQLAQLLEPVYGFQSLLAFKSKFQPQFVPLYMCYPDVTALPAIGTAISRAYLPNTSPRQSARLTKHLFEETRRGAKKD